MSNHPVITDGPAPSPTALQADPGAAAAVRRDGPAATAALLAAARRAANRRFATAWVVTLVLLLALLVTSVLLGGLRNIPAGDVLPAAFGLRTGLADYMIHRIRLPRALAALLGGALFGLAGALYQRLIRNPLATPDVVGISAGAGAGAVTVLLLVPAIPYGVEAAAVAGAFVMVGAVLLLSRQGGKVDTYRLVVIGIGLAAVATAYTNYLFTMAGEQGLAQVMRWLVGSVSGATWDGVTTLAVALAVCGICSALLHRPLASMSLGDELASGLGTRVGAARTAALLLGAGAAALATSVTGPIGFVSLVSGPVAARFVGTERALALAPAVGAVIVLAADVLAQHGPLISPVPTGAVTALIGAPYFVLLILRRGQGAPS
ncbi:FecCD family ABC transporter permease [Streptomyces erythrochromogenes]|uniref:FecCD family ABC transporter permease n=1 Tax=Streptomyces erythrochromogenes TaxID=285574 RepID=UPI0038695861|nr:iron ABC transporter permease [Streptomyces erythrochromogenes]